MTKTLKNEHCEACRADAPRVTQTEIDALLPQLSGWAIVSVEGCRQLERNFNFPNFMEALMFTNKVGALAEEEGHHPALLTEWGRVRVRWWTHKIKGLHRNDFVMAARTDALT